MMQDLKTGHLIGGRPKMQQIAQFAVTWIGALIAIGACSREEPQPKFFPVTIMLASFALERKFGSIPSIACSPSSA
jgi:hypothetical protein